MAVSTTTLRVARRLARHATALLVSLACMVPAASAIAASEETLATYLRMQEVPAMTRCTLQLVKQLAVANRQGDAMAASKAEAKYDACRSAALTAWFGIRNDLLAGGELAACLPTSIEMDGVRSRLHVDLRQILSYVFCDGAVASNGVHIPSDVSSYRYEAKLAKVVLRFVDRHGRCLITHRSRIAAAGGDAEALALAQSAYDRCYYTAARAAYYGVPSLFATSSGPTCLQSDGAVGLLGGHLAAWDVLDDIYCAP